MAISGQYFPGQTPTEKVFLVLRRSFITYVSFLLIAGIMSIPIFILAFLLMRYPDIFANETINKIITLAGSAYLLFILGLLLYGFVDFYLDVYIITDERIVDIKQTGFFRREISELHLREVQDVSARVKGFFPTFFHYGDIFIQTAAEKENFIFYSIQHPYRVSKKIADLHENQIERDRLQIEETLLRAGRPQIQSPQTVEAAVTQADNQVSGAKPVVQPSNQISQPDQYIDKGIDNESNFNPMSKTQLTGNNQQVQSGSEHYSERGIPDESEQGAVDGKATPSNFDQGLEDIDKFIAKTQDEENAVNPGHPKELEEGKIEDIYDD
jgi:hypothetical protein